MLYCKMFNSLNWISDEQLKRLIFKILLIDFEKKTEVKRYDLFCYLNEQKEKNNNRITVE